MASHVPSLLLITDFSKKGLQTFQHLQQDTFQNEPNSTFFIPFFNATRKVDIPCGGQNSLHGSRVLVIIF